ncbi:heat shock 70 kDa protein 12A-like [Mya arenaria]|uniref:heat shock 70 kDa protein 12A-like n=1 Tax=Mya arenaria TaxID=6604 RepID=UPI0022E5369C|nr:heat shock 70 kDa protein 12A-like [Mya arenaria]
MDESNHSETFVVALDLGTTYSGYAFSSRSNPLKIISNTWFCGSKNVSSKTPTCVLLHNDVFDSFGYDAETKYFQFAEEGQDEGWRLFSRFKMVLHEQAAGIDTSRLKLALEPEAASIWCESHSAEASIALAGTGTCYMVVDLGGGTADISVHERKADGTLREIHRASGGDWGGTNVDNNFIGLLEEVYGSERMHELKTKFQDDYLELLREFEAKKLAFQPNHGKLSLKLPESLHKSANPGVTKYKDKMEVQPGKIRIEAKNFASLFFDDIITKIANHLKELFKQPKLRSVQTIILVGGFAECGYLQEEVKAEFREKQLIVPEDPGMSVLKGAVKFGHFPLIVTSRIMKYTYGIEIHRVFDEKKHKHIKPVYNEKAKCHFIENYFSVFVSVDEEMKTDAKFTQMFEQRYGSDRTLINIFRSTLKDPSLVTEPESEKVGTVDIRHPVDNVKIYVTFMFGETELIVKARIQETGKEEIVSAYWPLNAGVCLLDANYWCLPAGCLIQISGYLSPNSVIYLLDAKRLVSAYWMPHLIQRLLATGRPKVASAYVTPNTGVCLQDV